MKRKRGRQPTVVDTNVLVVANHSEGQPLQCANACSQALIRIRKLGILLLDQSGSILDEYKTYCSHAGQPGVGDAFFKWTHDNRWRQDLVQVLSITENSDRGFDEFPDDPELAKFDRSDRKFVAVARVHGGSPPILNATDTDWEIYLHSLTKHGLVIEFLCPEQLREAE